MKYEVSIPKKQDSESFEKKKDNIGMFYIQKIDGVNNKTCKIELSMSKSAMLELGKELIRDALEDSSDILHFYPTRPDSGITETLGVFLHPNSVEPIVIDDDRDKSIDDLLK